MKKTLERVSSLEEQLKELLTHTPSVEGISRQIKDKSDRIVEIYDDGVIEDHAKITAFFDTFDWGRVDKLTESAKKILYVLKNDINYTEPMYSYRITQGLLDKQRAPLVAAYYQMFKEKPSFKALSPVVNEEFPKFINLAELPQLLNESEWLKHLPLSVMGNRGVDKIRKLEKVSEAIYTGLDKQTSQINNLLTACLKTIASGQEPTVSDKIDFTGNKLSSCGATVDFNILTEVSNKWGSMNTSFNFTDMSDNAHILLEDIVSSVFGRSEQLPEKAILKFCVNIAAVDFQQSLVGTLKNYNNLSHKLLNHSDKITRLSQLVSESPDTGPDSAYPSALSDISTLLSSYSNVVFQMTSFVSYTCGLLDELLLTAERLATVLTNYRKELDTYIAKQKETP